MSPAGNTFGAKVAKLMTEAVEQGASPIEVRDMLVGGAATITLAREGQRVHPTSIDRVVKAGITAMDKAVRS